MELFQFDPANVMSFLLTLFRVSLVVFVLPFFGGEATPTAAKVALCMVLTLTIWPQLSFPGTLFPAHPFGILVMLLGELLLGLTLNLMVTFIFAAVQTGGQLVGFQMGFSMVNVMDPETGASEAVTSHFLYMIALLTFLSLNGHLLLLKAVFESFKIIPPGGFFTTSALTTDVLKFSSEMFTLAIRISAPVVVALFLVDLALALISRAAPQMNILMLGFPLKITVGFLFLGLLFTLIAMYMKDFLIDLGPLLERVMRLGVTP